MNTILNHPIISAQIKCILIIVPMNVIKNWEDEFDIWFHLCKHRRTFHLFELFTITGPARRSEMLQKWQRLGGVMLITSGLFTALFTNENVFVEIFEKCLLDPGMFVKDVCILMQAMIFILF